jgi:transcriptional regulator with XRE-family HTH domain
VDDPDPAGDKTGMDDRAKVLARRLVATREALGLNAAELCRRIDCKTNRWSQYETGERAITLEIANRLCDEFRLSLDWIYRGDPSLLPGHLRLAIKARLAA